MTTTTATATRAFERSLLLLVGASTLLRLVLAAATGLGVDESYAVSVALPYSLSYFDHPPLHFWMAGAMVQLTGTTTALLVRLPFVISFGVTLFAIGTLGRRLFGERAGLLGALALASSGVLGVTTGTWVLPDGPLVAALAVAAVLAEAATRTPARGLESWLWLGVALAVGFLSKYHTALFGLGLAVFLVTDRTARTTLATSGPWLAAGVASIGLVPVLLWNEKHDWISFAFHGARATSDRPWSPAPFAEMLAGEAAWLLPWIAIPAGLALWRAWRTGPEDRGGWFCAMLASGPILVFSLVPLGGARGLPHWTAPGWLFVMPLVGRELACAIEEGRSWARGWRVAAPTVTAVLALLLAVHVQTGMLTRVLPGLNAPSDPSLDAVDWRSLADSLNARGVITSGEAARPIYARSWIQAGKLGVALGPHARVRCFCDDPHHFGLRPGGREAPDTTALVIEHAQPWRRQWRPAHRVWSDRLHLDSVSAVTITPRGARAITLLLYRVAAPRDQAANRRVNRYFRDSDTSEREIDA